MADIFLSYARADLENAKLIINSLERLGFSVWWDSGLTPDRSFDDKIEAELDNAKAVVVLWSPTSVTSKWVRLEAISATEQDKLFPAMIEECQIPFAFKLTQAALLHHNTPINQGEEWERLLSWLYHRVRQDDRKQDVATQRPTEASASITAPDNGDKTISNPDVEEHDTDLSNRLNQVSVSSMLMGGGAAIVTVLLITFFIGTRLGTGCLVGLPDARSLLANSEAPVSGDSGCISQPFSAFRDCEECPEMVTLPAGRFEMGASTVDGGYTDERPIHSVSLNRSFAIGRFEVTWDDWNQCMKDGACETAGTARTDRTGSLPLNSISLAEAQSFIDWLNRKSGQKYRLPSEAEWEYAAKAGRDLKYSMTENTADICNFSNVLDRSGYAKLKNRLKPSVTAFDCADNYTFLAPVGSFAPSSFGLYDVIGNVSEMVLDCYTPNYDQASPFGEPPEREDCQLYVVRGGSWYSHSNFTRVSYRSNIRSTYKGSDTLGFRVVREIN